MAASPLAGADGPPKNYPEAASTKIDIFHKMMVVFVVSWVKGDVKIEATNHKQGECSSDGSDVQGYTTRHHSSIYAGLGLQVPAMTHTSGNRHTKVIGLASPSCGLVISASLSVRRRPLGMMETDG